MMPISYSYIDSQPIIELLIKDKSGRWNRFLAYVDSGAAVTVLTRDDAKRVGLTLEKGERIELHGVSGVIPAYLHSVEIKVARRTFNAKVAFSTSNETPRLIGRRGLFDKFVVCFNDKHRIVSFTDNLLEKDWVAAAGFLKNYNPDGKMFSRLLAQKRKEIVRGE